MDGIEILYLSHIKKICQEKKNELIWDKENKYLHGMKGKKKHYCS